MNDEWRQYRRRLIRQLGWMKWSVLIAFVFFFVHLPELPPGRIWDDLFVSLIWSVTVFVWVYVAYGGLFYWITWQKVRHGKTIELGIPAYVVIGIVFSGAGIVTSQWLEAKWEGYPFHPHSLLQPLLTGSFISLFFTFLVAYKRTREKALMLEAEHARAQLHALQSQMQPHFLFNSLNSLAELVEQDPSQAGRMAQTLSDLYREILANSRLQTCSLASEASIARKYLELESIRFGSRLRYAFDVPGGSEQVELPSLVLQTLVENALKHGIARLAEGGEVRVRVAPEGEGYRLSVENTAGAASTRPGAGVGLANTRSRLDLLYGSRHGFALETAGETTRASFWFTGERHA